LPLPSAAYLPVAVVAADIAYVCHCRVATPRYDTILLFALPLRRRCYAADTYLLMLLPP